MEVTVAKSAGFCFGVKRAVNLVYEEAGGSGPVYTMGPIIHNDLVVSDLRERGVKIINDDMVCEEDGARAGEGSTIIVRSHGIPRDLMEKVNGTGARIVDATCPFVFILFFPAS